MVVGGGGARGAWGVGFAKYLDSTLRKHDQELKWSHEYPKFNGYKIVYGTSTGSLMAPLIVLSDYNKLKAVYTNISQNDIFNVNPFKPNGKIKILKSTFRALRGKESIGESENLKNLLLNTPKGLSQEEYNRIVDKKNNTRFTVTVTNMKNGTLEYHSSDDNDRKSMINWIWASANEPLFMSYFHTDAGNGQENSYVDGGVISNVPVIEALKYADSVGINEIDVIVNKPYAAVADTVFKKRDLFDGLLKLIDLWGVQVRNSNIEIAQLEAYSMTCDTIGIHQLYYEKKNEDREVIAINVHYFPPAYFDSTSELGDKRLNQKELVFDSVRMRELWDAGEKGLEDTTVPKENYRILFKRNSNSNSIKQIYNLYKAQNKNMMMK